MSDMTKSKAEELVGKGIPPPLQSALNFDFNMAGAYLDGWESREAEVAKLTKKYDELHFAWISAEDAADFLYDELSACQKTILSEREEANRETVKSAERLCAAIEELVKEREAASVLVEVAKEWAAMASVRAHHSSSERDLLKALATYAQSRKEKEQ